MLKYLRDREVGKRTTRKSERGIAQCKEPQDMEFEFVRIMREQRELWMRQMHACRASGEVIPGSGCLHMINMCNQQIKEAKDKILELQDNAATTRDKPS